MEALRQSARSMYAYACFDLECLYRELAGQPRKNAHQILSARAEKLVCQISHELQSEILAAEDTVNPEIVAIAEGFAENMKSLCRGLLNPILDAWVRRLPL